MKLSLDDLISVLYPKFPKTNKNIKFLILKEIPPRYFLKNIPSRYCLPIKPGDKLLESFHSLYCCYCHQRLKYVNTGERDSGMKCFNIDCGQYLGRTDFNFYWNYSMYDNCPKCKNPTKFSGCEDVIFFCNDCEWWWSYHPKMVNGVPKHCKMAEYVGWHTCVFADDYILMPVMPVYSQQKYKTYRIRDFYTKDELLEKGILFYDDFPYEETEYGIEQSDTLRFKCPDCNEVFDIDPIGS